MEKVFQDVWKMIVESNVLNLVWAVLVLVVGWLIAVFVSGCVRKGLDKIGIEAKINRMLPKGSEIPSSNIDKFAGRAVYFLILLFAVLGCLAALNLTEAASPIRKFVDTLTEYAANIIGAAALAFIAWLVATIVKIASNTAIRTMKIGKKLAETSEVKDETAFAETTSGILYWVVLLFFLPAILRTLKIGGITAPVEQMFSKILEYIPNLIAAAAILFVGLFAAKIVRKAVSGLIVITRLEEVGEKAGVSKVFGNKGLSSMIGIVAYILVAIPVVISSLTALKIDSLSDSVAGFFNKLLDATGDILGAALLIFVAFLAGSFVSGIVTQICENFGFNTLMAKLGVKAKDDSATTPAVVVGKISLVAILFMAAIAAADILNFDGLSELLGTFLQFGGNVILGLIVLLIGIWLSNFAADSVKGKCSDAVVMIVRVGVLVFTAAIALHSMDIGSPIVQTAFTFLLGSVCVAAALAFGLGGRDFAAEKLNEWKEKFGKKN